MLYHQVPCPAAEFFHVVGLVHSSDHPQLFLLRIRSFELKPRAPILVDLRKLRQAMRCVGALKLGGVPRLAASARLIAASRNKDVLMSSFAPVAGRPPSQVRRCL